MQDLYLSQLKAAVDSRDAFVVSSLFSPLGDTHTFSTLRSALTDGPTLRPTSYTNLTRSFFADYRPFADFVASYLLFARDADLDSMEASTVLAAYQLLEDCFKAADKVFAQGETGWFVPTLRKFTRALVALALEAGKICGDTNLTKAGEAATLLRRPMTIAASDRNTESPSKRDALFFLANATFKVYFALKNLRLCDTILNNTQAATALLETYSKADRVAFSYYRGRIFLYQRRLPQARAELTRAFELCNRSSRHNGRLILLYLIVASLPLGIFPSDALLEEFNLHNQFGNLLPALQLGDCVGVRTELDLWQPWHLSKGNYLLLREKLEVVCWRNLARRTLFVVSHGSPLPPTGPPTLSLYALLTTARISFGDDKLDVDDIECMCASLIDQGYLKAYVLHSKRLLVFMKGPQVGFPPMASVNPV